MTGSIYQIEKSLSRRYVRHILFWSAYILTMTYIHGLGMQEGSYFPWFMNYLFELPLIIGLTYTIAYFILPRMLKKNRYFINALLTLLPFLIFSALNLWLDNSVIRPIFFQVDSQGMEMVGILKNAFGLAFPVVIFLSLSLIRKHSGKFNQNYKVHNGLKSELALIRSRMHPVFLHDALNDIYKVSNENPDILPEMILKISDILHYFLFECGSEFVPVRKEEQAIRIYLGFEKLTFGEKFNYDIHIQGDIESSMISPYVILPLVRAVCRFHPDYDNNPGKVFIHLLINAGVLNFSASQKILGENLQTKFEFDWKEEINMSRRRLELMYPWRYNLDIIETERKLMVNLSVSLNKEGTLHENPMPNSR